MKIEIGTKLWFMGFEPETEIISIDESNNSWIGLDFDSKHLYPLDEIEKYWLDHPVSKDEQIAIMINMYRILDLKTKRKYKCQNPIN